MRDRDARAARRNRGAPRHGDRRSRRARRGSARRRRRGAARARQPVADPGGDPRRLGRPLARARRAGHALRAADLPPQPRLRARRHPVADARHRRQHRALPGRQRGPAARASGRRSREPGRSAARRHGRRARQLPDLAPGGDLPDLAGDRSAAAGVLRRLRLGRRHRSTSSNGGEMRTARGAVGQRRVFPCWACSRPPAGCWTPTTTARLRAARGPEPRVLAARLRRRSGRRRPHASRSDAHAGRDRRRRAGGVLRPRSRHDRSTSPLPLCADPVFSDDGKGRLGVGHELVAAASSAG